MQPENKPAYKKQRQLQNGGDARVTQNAAASMPRSQAAAHLAESTSRQLTGAFA